MKRIAERGMPRRCKKKGERKVEEGMGKGERSGEEN